MEELDIYHITVGIGISTTVLTIIITTEISTTIIIIIGITTMHHDAVIFAINPTILLSIVHKGITIITIIPIIPTIISTVPTIILITPTIITIAINGWIYQ